MFSFRNLTPVTKNLLIFTVLVYVVTILLEDRIDMYRLFGLHYPQASNFKPYQLVTYIFMHATRDRDHSLVLSHIFFNMFALFMFGPALESSWGPKRFFIFYIFTGLGAAITQLVIYYFQITPQLEQWQSAYNATHDFAQQTFMLEDKKAFLNAFTVVGASGSLFGVLLGFGMMFPNMELMIIPIPIPIKAKFLVAIYGAMELFSGLSNNPDDNVAHFAHLGGMLFGFLLIMIWRRKR